MRRAKAPLAGKSASLNHHQRCCQICNHPEREQIERNFLDWADPRAIARQYGLNKGSPIGLYRHARAIGLLVRRRHNARTALERIIEQVGGAKPSAAAVVSAVQAYVKINSEGRWVEEPERVYLRELFDRMTREELETYAREGKLPEWFTQTISATAGFAPGAPRTTPGDKPEHAA